MRDKSKLTEACRQNIQAVKDTQDLLSGKWKCCILGMLYFSGKARFMEIHRHIDGIAPKVLSKELKDLEMNHLVKRTVQDTMPITVEYELTAHGESLKPVIEAMEKWGKSYRNNIIVENNK
ncbi:winged helix-turn-helix transcriptional regulator [Pedobacter endophyticus]|uniref:Helix-turn-helix transcriptional regulator n=1 Tax=Pedobacter endophyticus TaxID=2789740 RepID=A0A7U3Q4Z8_9SPHI|nr:helix-turn-helix domain-containing protein [Pedobacter endophyticus]QPH38695.1 helix-turn-helix transcriptional regulator [Pedobacter endophyticus]